MREASYLVILLGRKPYAVQSISYLSQGKVIKRLQGENCAKSFDIYSEDAPVKLKTDAPPPEFRLPDPPHNSQFTN